MPAKYTPSAEEDELYGVRPPGDAAPPAAKAPGEDREPETTDEEINESQQSAIIDNKVLTGPDGKPPKAGDEIIVKVVKVYGNESEIVYGPPKKEPGAETDSMASAGPEIDALDEKDTY